MSKVIGRMRGGGRKGRNREASTYPLRQIVEEYIDHRGVPLERLECGHTMTKRSDMIGNTNAVRRRCKQCAEAKKGQG